MYKICFQFDYEKTRKLNFITFKWIHVLNNSLITPLSYHIASCHIIYQKKRKLNLQHLSIVINVAIKMFTWKTPQNGVSRVLSSPNDSYKRSILSSEYYIALRNLTIFKQKKSPEPVLYLKRRTNIPCTGCPDSDRKRLKKKKSFYQV